MRIPGRHPGLPADVAATLDIAAGDRVLAWSPLAGGGAAAATVRGLSVLTPFGRVISRPWTDVDHAAWETESGMLAVWWVDSRSPTPLEVTDASRLPEVVHDRVRASVVLSAEVVVPGGRRVWVALRKAADGTISEQAVPRPGVRMDDPEVAAVVRQAQADLAGEAGLD